MTKLTHLDEQGAARMVDVSDKPASEREATAEAVIALSPEAFAAVVSGDAPKGDVLAVARIAGIMAAKKVPDLIPLCHTLLITAVTVDFDYMGEDFIKVTSMVKCTGQTGVEMEALTAASVSCLTIYDMCKAIDRGMTIENVRLLQ